MKRNPLTTAIVQSLAPPEYELPDPVPINEYIDWWTREPEPQWPYSTVTYFEGNMVGFDELSNMTCDEWDRAIDSMRNRTPPTNIAAMPPAEPSMSSIDELRALGETIPGAVPRCRWCHEPVDHPMCDCGDFWSRYERYL